MVSPEILLTRVSTSMWIYGFKMYYQKCFIKYLHINFCSLNKYIFSLKEIIKIEIQFFYSRNSIIQNYYYFNYYSRYTHSNLTFIVKKKYILLKCSA